MSTTPRAITGSLSLGRDLRRLRGSRKLQDIASLSERGDLGGTTRPLSVAALSEIENGKYLPNLDALVTLCVTYRTSPAHFVGRLLEERLVAGQDVPADAAELERETVAALAEGRWARALALVVSGIERAEDEESRLKWRVRRAAVLSNVGLVDQAVHELQDVLESPQLPASRRARVHLEIAGAASRLGHFTLATFHCEAANEEATDRDDRALRLLALQTAVALALRRGEKRERELRVAMVRIDAAVALLAPEDRRAALALEIYRAQVHERLGSKTYAHEQYRRLEAECESSGSAHLHACVLVSDAELLASTGNREAARAKLVKAAGIASDCHAIDEAFEAHYLLMTLARDEHERERHRRSCGRLASLATQPTPRMRQLEAGTADGGRP